MISQDAIKAVNTAIGSKPGLMANIQRVLSKHDLIRRYSDPNDILGVAWIVCAAALAPTSEYKKLDEWVSGKKAFWAAQFRQQKKTALHAIAFAISSQQEAKQVVSVTMDKETGAGILLYQNGQTMRFGEETDKPIDYRQTIREHVVISGALFAELAEGIQAAAETEILTQN